MMKKLVLALFVLGIAIPSFAGLKVKDVEGTWSYEVVMEYESISGTLVFTKSGKELNGEVHTNEGQIIPMTKVEIQDNNVLYFELVVDYSTFKVSVTIEDKKYKGTLTTDNGDAAITGEKIE